MSRKGGWQSANRNRNGKTCVSRKRKAETELKAKHDDKHDACQKLQVASCAFEPPPPLYHPSPLHHCLLTVFSCICQCAAVRVCELSVFVVGAII